MVAAASPHPVAPFEGVPRLLQQVDHHLLGEEGLPVGVNAGAQGQVGALPDPLLQLLDAAERAEPQTHNVRLVRRDVTVRRPLPLWKHSHIGLLSHCVYVFRSMFSYQSGNYLSLLEDYCYV